MISLSETDCLVHTSQFTGHTAQPHMIPPLPAAAYPLPVSTGIGIESKGVYNP
jgi:hypothetical protein